MRMMFKQKKEDLDDEDGVYSRYYPDSSLFNLWQLQAHIKTLGIYWRYCSCCAQGALQNITFCSTVVGQLFEVELEEDGGSPATCTTGIVLFSPHLQWHELKAVHRFPSLGCIITSDVKAIQEKSQLRWAGHMSWMRNRLHKITQHGIMCN